MDRKERWHLSRPFKSYSPITMASPPMDPVTAERKSTMKPNIKKDRGKRLISQSNKEGRSVLGLAIF